MTKEKPLFKNNSLIPLLRWGEKEDFGYVEQTGEQKYIKKYTAPLKTGLLCILHF